MGSELLRPPKVVCILEWERLEIRTRIFNNFLFRTEKGVTSSLKIFFLSVYSYHVFVLVFAFESFIKILLELHMHIKWIITSLWAFLLT